MNAIAEVQAHHRRSDNVVQARAKSATGNYPRANLGWVEEYFPPGSDLFAGSKLGYNLGRLASEPGETVLEKNLRRVVHAVAPLAVPGTFVVHVAHEAGWRIDITLA